MPRLDKKTPLSSADSGVQSRMNDGIKKCTYSNIPENKQHFYYTIVIGIKSDIDLSETESVRCSSSAVTFTEYFRTNVPGKE